MEFYTSHVKKKLYRSFPKYNSLKFCITNNELWSWNFPKLPIAEYFDQLNGI